MNNQNKQSNRKMKFAGLGAAIGLIFGALVGLLIGNPIIFSGGGMVLGIAIGASFDQRRAI